MNEPFEYEDDDTVGKQDVEHGLIMPFVSVASKGGPYEDVAYCAGYEMGQLAGALQFENPRTWEGYIRTPNVDQVDLIAMMHGYVVVDVNEYQFDQETVGGKQWCEWTHVILRKESKLEINVATSTGWRRALLRIELRLSRMLGFES